MPNKELTQWELFFAWAHHNADARMDALQTALETMAAKIEGENFDLTEFRAEIARRWAKNYEDAMLRLEVKHPGVAARVDSIRDSASLPKNDP